MASALLPQKEGILQLSNDFSSLHCCIAHPTGRSRIHTVDILTGVGKPWIALLGANSVYAATNIRLSPFLCLTQDNGWFDEKKKVKLKIIS